MPQRTLQHIQLDESDFHQFEVLAARESRTLKDLGTILIRFGLLQLRSRTIESVSAMTNALFHDHPIRQEDEKDAKD